MNRLFFSIAAVTLSCFSLAAQDFTLADELRNMYRIDLLPSYREGVVEQFSSYDRTWGNDDGFSGTYSYLRKENGKSVLAEIEGPGVINRIWAPFQMDDSLEFYFDHSDRPGLTISCNDLFGGKYPFVPPLCSNDAGGFYCYMPIPFASGCKVVFTGEKMLFYQLQYRRLEGKKVKTFSLPLSADEQSELESVGRVWNTAECRIPDSGKSASCEMEEETFILSPGQEKVFFETDKGGRICSIEIDAPEAFTGYEKDILLRAVWDGEKEYAVDAPAADFFGYAFGRPAARSLLLGYSSGTNYAMLPAPFDHSAAVSLKYEKREGMKQFPVQITTRVRHNTMARDRRSEGKLYTCWRREQPQKGEYYTFLRHRGRGHYVGTVLSAQGLNAGMPLFFEGDDSTYVDGGMRIHGTGSEDYFNGGSYAVLDRWDKLYCRPIHGCLGFSVPMARTGGYRFYLSDKLSFGEEFYTGIEHGEVGNTEPVDYTSVAFFYSDTPPGQQMEPSEDLRRVYIPERFQFIPQTLHITADALVNFWYLGIRCTFSGTGLVRIDMPEIPEGRYRVYVDYYESPSGAMFSIWQSSHILKEWTSTEAAQEKLLEKVYCGEMVVTPYDNTITFRFEGENNTRFFEFGTITLERM